ncbi:hypothetical protein O0I10_010992 [Lichtheimia ornata]|uniref:Uncharacterized protein n=1 Tax=Lichtheimia ornata TaxID=688661 RepID=A0AAD7UUI8_9FUNG|nr:uncharacterized protein O0I10_010992 [Lichtheimia ornata]KAJ8653341.1 hypothetical protein O0I10_010992 [Lichtheimia ornata]
MGEQVVNGDSFQLQPFNNKFSRDLPLTQASIAIQHIGVVSSIHDPMRRRVHSLPSCPQQEAFTLSLLEITRRLYIASFGLNMLDDGTSGSNRIRISKQECCMVGSMQQHILDRMDTRLFTTINGTVLRNTTRASFGDAIIIKAARQGRHCITLSCGALHVVPGDSATHVAASGI